MTEPTDNLQQRCAEIVEWQRTGVLSGSTLRNHAKTHWAGYHDSLQMAERDTLTKAVEWVAKWGTPPAVAGEPVAWLSTDCIGERYLCFTKPKDSDHARPLVFGDTTQQPAQAQAGAVPLTYQQVIDSWNAQADQYNQWDALGEDEKIEWAVACATNAARSQAKKGGRDAMPML